MCHVMLPIGSGVLTKSLSVSNPDEFHLVPVSGSLIIIQKNDVKITDIIAKVLYNNIKSFSIFVE